MLTNYTTFLFFNYFSYIYYYCFKVIHLNLLKLFFLVDAGKTFLTWKCNTKHLKPNYLEMCKLDQLSSD